MTQLQHSQEFVKEVNATNMRQILMITSDSCISWRMAHFTNSSLLVRKSTWTPPAFEPQQPDSGAFENPDLAIQELAELAVGAPGGDSTLSRVHGTTAAGGKAV